MLPTPSKVWSTNVVKMKPKRFINGEWVSVTPLSTSFSPNNRVTPVEPDQSMSIRQIYQAWAQGRPTSVHPFQCEFDDDADEIDHDEENPIDMCQIEDRVLQAQSKIDNEKQVHKQKQINQQEEDKFFNRLKDTLFPLNE